MKYLETKHERNSAKITSLIVLILLLLLFVVGPPYMDPPLEYGVAVNFGTSDVGSGDIQPTEPIKSKPRDVVPQIEETKSEPTTPSKSSENVITADNAEAIAIKKQKEIADAKAKADAQAKAAEEKKKKEEADKKAKLDALIGGVKKSDGKTTGGEGDDKSPGDKGQLDGDPYAPSYFGSGGNGSGGSGGSGYGLNGRGKPSNGKVVPKCDEEGRVVVEIHVNRDGRVTKAIPGVKGTTGDLCLYEAAKQTALTYKWPADSKAPANQIGFVKIDFSVTQ